MFEKRTNEEFERLNNTPDRNKIRPEEDTERKI